MYILYAPVNKFGRLPPETPLFCPEIRFTNNLAICHQRFWLRAALMHGIENVTPPDVLALNKELKPQTILVCALGGIGDILWATTAVKLLKEKYPHARINVNTTAKYLSLWLNNPYIAGFAALAEHIIPHAIYSQDEAIDFGGCVAGNPEANKKHAIDLHLERAGIDIKQEPSKKLPFIRITKKEKLKARDLLQDLGIDVLKDVIVGVHLEGSAPSRTWPYSRSQFLTEKLCAKGYKVLLLGTNRDFDFITGHQCECGATYELKTQQQIDLMWFYCTECKKYNTIKLRKQPNGAHVLTGKTKLREAIAVITQLNLFIGPDSGLLQAATSQGIPSIGLYGPFDAKVRTAYFDKHRDIQGSCDSGPCFKHMGYCDKGYPSPCMLDIPVELVFNTTKELLKKYPVKRQANWRQFDVDTPTIKRPGSDKDKKPDKRMDFWQGVRRWLRIR